MPILPRVTDLLADAVAELYEADPDGFTGRRQELATRARDAGEPAVAKQITAIPLIIIPPPAIAPRAMTVGPIIDAATSGAAQTMAPIIQSAVPTMIFIADQRLNRSDANDVVDDRS